jgi:hypothetical protein
MRGSQKPRLEHVPPRLSSAGQDVVDFAAEHGLFLDPWQQYVLDGALGEMPDGGWVTPDVTLIVSRQNGKGAVLEALVLAWLFLFNESKVLFSAHELKTAVEMFKRIRDLCKASEELDKQIAHYYASNEKTSIELLDGRECRFMARSKGSGRGFSAQKIVFDEAYNLPDDIHDAQKPTTGAMAHPQTWYTSSAGDQDIAPCDVLARMRRLGIAKDPNVAFFEWSVPYDERTLKIHGSADDPKLWAVANPSMGIRKRETTIAGFQRTMSPAGFAREELGVGNWPDPEAVGAALPYGAWRDLADVPAERGKDFVFGVDIAQDGSAWLAVAWKREDGSPHVSLANEGQPLPAYRLNDECKRIAAEWSQPHFYAAPVIAAELVKAGVKGEPVKSTEFTAACRALAGALEHGQIRHHNQTALNEAVRVVKWRSAGTAGERAWQLKDAPEVGPLAAATRALHGLSTDRPSVYEERGLVTL